MITHNTEAQYQDEVCNLKTNLLSCGKHWISSGKYRRIFNSLTPKNSICVFSCIVTALWKQRLNVLLGNYGILISGSWYCEPSSCKVYGRKLELMSLQCSASVLWGLDYREFICTFFWLYKQLNMQISEIIWLSVICGLWNSIKMPLTCCLFPI